MYIKTAKWLGKRNRASKKKRKNNNVGEVVKNDRVIPSTVSMDPQTTLSGDDVLKETSQTGPSLWGGLIMVCIK